MQIGMMHIWDVFGCCRMSGIFYFRFSLCAEVDDFEFYAEFVIFCDCGKVLRRVGR